jgi:hypothetical protein
MRSQQPVRYEVLTACSIRFCGPQTATLQILRI